MWAAFRFPAPLRSWALYFFGPLLDCPHFLPYYSVIPAAMTQSCWASLRKPFTLSPSGLVWQLVFLLMGSCVPLGILGPCAFFGLLWPNYRILILRVHGPAINSLLSLFALLWACGLLTSLGFPGPITLFSSLRFIGLPLTPYFFCLHYFGPTVALSHFSTSYTTHGYAISLFPGFFKPTCLFKAHLFISWAYDPLFLPLGPNGFAICLPILCCPCRWAFFFLLGFSQMTLNTYNVIFIFAWRQYFIVHIG